MMSDIVTLLIAVAGISGTLGGSLGAALIASFSQRKARLEDYRLTRRAAKREALTSACLNMQKCVTAIQLTAHDIEAGQTSSSDTKNMLTGMREAAFEAMGRVFLEIDEMDSAQFETMYINVIRAFSQFAVSHREVTNSNRYLPDMDPWDDLHKLDLAVGALTKHMREMLRTLDENHTQVERAQKWRLLTHTVRARTIEKVRSADSRE